MKILSIVGARPQFIKAAALSRAIAEDPQIDEVLVHTGQHYDPNMSGVFFKDLGIPRPHYQLSLQEDGAILTHARMTGRILEALEKIMLKEQPHYVLVYGDTNSTLAGALAAAKLEIPVAHIEAGLRSYNRQMPEEINRIITDRLSTILFCPSASARDILAREGIAGPQVAVVGDIMRDSLQLFGQAGLDLPIPFSAGEYLLCTLHRQENIDNHERLDSIMEALQVIADRLPVVVPAHPRLRKRWTHLPKGIHWIDPQPYPAMINLIAQSRLVMTDSGGLQKEAFYLQRYCLTLRDETEWSELVAGGYNLLAGWRRGAILSGLEELLSRPPFTASALYGKGDTAQQIIRALLASV